MLNFFFPTIQVGSQPHGDLASEAEISFEGEEKVFAFHKARSMNICNADAYIGFFSHDQVRIPQNLHLEQTCVFDINESSLYFRKAMQ